MPEGGASSLVSVMPDGTLHYGADEDGNRICDFSCAGYRGAGVPVPDVSAVLTLSPSGGDGITRDSQPTTSSANA